VPDAYRQDAAFQQFLRRVWRQDVAPLLRGRRAEQRARLARLGGAVAGATGRAIDSLLRLRGRPFARAMTVMGSRLGAIIPDAWDWQWLRRARAGVRRLAEHQARRRAEALDDAEALRLFDLPPTATHDEFRRAWHDISRRWHPDLAKDEAQRCEYHLRFVAYQAARRRLEEAYESGRLPRPPRT